MEKWKPKQATENQLFWLEECPELYVRIIVKPKGIPFNLCFLEEFAQIKDIPAILRQYEGSNIWRSWEVFEDANGERLVGPIPYIIDVDDEDENLEHAWEITLASLDFLESYHDWFDSPERIRVVFSGRKGFHIEFKPLLPINMEDARKSLIHYLQDVMVDEYMSKNNTFYKGENSPRTVLDLYHEYIRITGSIYSWVADDGKFIKRRVYQMKVNEFRSSDSRRILKLSQNL